MDIPRSEELQRWLDALMSSYSSQVDRASAKNWESAMSPYFARNQYLSGTMATAGKDYAQHYADLKAEYAKELEAQRAMLEFQRAQQMQQDWNRQQAMREQSLQGGAMRDQMTTAAAMGSPFWGHDQESGGVTGLFEPGYWYGGQWQRGAKPWWLDSQQTREKPNYGQQAYNAGNKIGLGAQSRVYNSNSPLGTRAGLSRI